MLLVLGFFTCGFQLAFVTVHLPAYLLDRGLSADVGAWTVGVIGLFNIVGSLASGWLGERMPKRFILAIIYFGRALAIVAFITLPARRHGAKAGVPWYDWVLAAAGFAATGFLTWEYQRLVDLVLLRPPDPVAAGTVTPGTSFARNSALRALTSGQIPAMMGMRIPSRSMWSRKRKSCCTSKTGWVMAYSAPASTFQ